MSEKDNQVPNALVRVGDKALAVRSATLVKRGLALAESLQPGDAAADSWRRRMLERKARLDGAIAKYRTAIRLQPDYANDIAHLGLALEMKGDRLGALDEIEKVRERFPTDSMIAEVYERIRRKAG